MNFKQYLEELHNIEVGQAVTAHEPTDKASMSVDNPLIVSEINTHFIREFNEVVLSPDAGLQKIRKVLHRYGFDMPALYEIDREGDEVVFDLNQFGMEMTPDYYLYVLYYLTDDGYYDFYVEVADDDRVEELTSEDEDEQEED
jgi:hypothetical protein